VAFAVPVKVTVALCPEQIVWFAAIVTTGAGITVITTDPVSGWLQLGVPEVAPLTNAKVVVTEKLLVTVAVPAASKVMVCETPLAVYVIMAFGVPAKVIVALCPAQIVWLEAMVTVGGGTTVIVTVPVMFCEQLGVPDEATLTSAKTVVAE
jgi:hypothetical protein